MSADKWTTPALQDAIRATLDTHRGATLNIEITASIAAELARDLGESFTFVELLARGEKPLGLFHYVFRGLLVAQGCELDSLVVRDRSANLTQSLAGNFDVDLADVTDEIVIHEVARPS